MKKLLHTQQESTWDCGIACVTTILRSNGTSVNFNFIKDMSPKNTNGLSMKDLIYILNKFDSAPKALQMDPSNINKLVNSSIFPFIALTKDNHFVVVHKIFKKNILISDPKNDSLKKVKTKNFIDSFSGKLITIEGEHNVLHESKLRKKQLLTILNQNKFKILLLFICSLIIVILGIVSSFFMKIVVDMIIPNHLNSALDTFAFIFLFVLILKNLLEFIRNKATILISKHIDFSLSMDFLNKIFKLPLSFFEKRDSGEFITRFDDISYLRNMISGVLVSAIIDSFLIVVSGYVLFFQDPTLFFVSLIPIILYLANSYLFFDPLRNKNMEFMEKHTEVTSFLIQSVQNIENIYSLSTSSMIKNMLNKKVSSFLKISKSLEDTINVSSTLNNLISSFFQIIVIWIGVTKILNGALSLGTLLTFTALLSYFVGAIDRLVTIQPTLQKSFVAMERYYNILHYDEHIEEKNSGRITNLKKIRKLEIRNLSYEYEYSKQIFQNLNLVITENKCVALMGESGVGKSTFAKLLTKLYPCSSGTILYNNIDINDISNSKLKEKVVYLSQQSFFWRGTIKENLSMGNTFTDNDIYLACEKACLKSTIINFKDNLNTLISENGENFSSGQKQRLALARIFLLKPDVIIIDEVMSNLDEYNEKIILNNLKKLESIKIVITHKNFSKDMFDHIYTLNPYAIKEI